MYSIRTESSHNSKSIIWGAQALLTQHVVCKREGRSVWGQSTEKGNSEEQDFHPTIFTVQSHILL